MVEKEDYEYIAGNMRAIRAKLGLTAKECGEKMGISRQAYSRYEKNPEQLRVSTLEKIAKILNCKLVDFFKE